MTQVPAQLSVTREPRRSESTERVEGDPAFRVQAMAGDAGVPGERTAAQRTRKMELRVGAPGRVTTDTVDDLRVVQLLPTIVRRLGAQQPDREQQSEEWPTH